jgi:hypothetical protein
MMGHSTTMVRPSNGDTTGEHVPDLVVLALIFGGWGSSRRKRQSSTSDASCSDRSGSTRLQLSAAGTLLLLSEIVVGSKYLREESG